MRELLEYRTNLIDRLVSAVQAFRDECLAVQDPYAPLEAGGWSAHQTAVHTRDVDKLVYGSRARRTAVEDNPEFQNFDGDAHMDEHYSINEPLTDVLDELVAQVTDLAGMLRALPPRDWSRESRHAMLGRGLTLQTWVEKDLGHIREHLEVIKKHRAG